MWTVSLQYRRLQTSEPEDGQFVLRKWADFHFLIVALTRLRRAANLAKKVKKISNAIEQAIVEFDSNIPNLKTMRDVAEHIDDYAVDKGKNKNIDRRGLEVSIFNDTLLEWLGYKLDLNVALEASQNLFNSIRENKPVIRAKNT